MATGRIGTTPVLQVRWSKAPSAGTTSLSGLDDNSVSLVYSVGYEAVYRNGVLLSRTNDYTATDGTTVTLIDATIAGDIIEIFANQTIPLSDTYSQTVSDGRFIKNTLTTTTGDIIYASAANTPARLGIGSTDQVLKVSGGVPVWAAPAAGSFVGCTAYKTTTAQSISNATDTTISYNAEEFDTDGFHDNSTNNTRFTIPSGKGGKYLITAIATTAVGSGPRQIQVKKNGGTDQLSTLLNAASTYSTQIVLTGILDLAVADYLELFMYQESGGSLNALAGQHIQRFSLYYLGA